MENYEIGSSRVIGTTADGDGEHAPVIIPPDDSPATATSASPATRSAAPTAGSSARVALPDVNHICRIPGCVRRATDTEHGNGNHTLCCDRCSYTDGRFHTAVCDAADYDLTAPSSSAVSAPVGATDRNDFVPGCGTTTTLKTTSFTRSLMFLVVQLVLLFCRGDNNAGGTPTTPPSERKTGSEPAAYINAGVVIVAPLPVEGEPMNKPTGAASAAPPRRTNTLMNTYTRHHKL